MMKLILLIGIYSLLLAGCGGEATTPAATEMVERAPPTQTLNENPTDESAQQVTTVPIEVPTSTPPAATEPAPATPTSLPTATMGPEDWREMPVIPNVGDRVLEIYERGLELGNNPAAFSKIGDCGATPAWFLGDFDGDPKYYSLGEYEELEGVIDYFQGSYARTSLAAKSGFNASSVFTTLWTDREHCQVDEIPIACEYRVHRPMVALVALGTNDVHHQESFEERMRDIIEFSIENGVIPILSTKADNLEGDNSINATIARLAVEYQVPLWNYWLAVQPLPNQGLQNDEAHLTRAGNQFDNPAAMQTGWTVRNLNALQVLDVVMNKIEQSTPAEP